MKGFHSPDKWHAKVPLSLEPLCGTCGLHKTCKSPFMKVDGRGRKKVLIVAEAPGRNEDDQGRPLVGNAGERLAEILWGLGVNMRKDCWLTNALICRPPENRTPTTEEVGYCRPNLVKSLYTLKPDIIIPLGLSAVKSVIPLAWKEGEKMEFIETWVGWQIPSQKLNAWICPSYHPSFLLHQEGEGKNTATMFCQRHLAGAFALKGRPWPDGPPDYRRRVDIEMNHRTAAMKLKAMRSNLPLAIDLETTTLKPDGPHAGIICCSVSDGISSLVFPWAGKVVGEVKDLITSGHPMIAANMKFEERWFRKFLKRGVKNWVWDTVVGAHVMDCKKLITSLKFQALVLLGVADYNSHIEPLMKGKRDNSNAPNRLREVSPEELMLYCATDSLLEVLVAQKQAEIMGVELCPSG